MQVKEISYKIAHRFERDFAPVHDILLAFRYDQKTNEELRRLGLFLKTSGPERQNTPFAIRYQFEWLCKFYGILPEHIPRPYSFLEMDYGEGNKKVGYLLQHIDMERLVGSIHMPVFKDRIREQLKLIFDALKQNGAHGDLENNTFIRMLDGQVFLIDPADYYSDVDRRKFDEKQYSYLKWLVR
jgi:hypothetical protein